MPSPVRFSPSTAVAIASPGQMAIHGATKSTSRASCSMPPQRRGRRLRPQPKIRERRFRQHRAGERHGHLDQQGAGDVGQHVPADDAQIIRPHRPGGEHVLLVADDEGLRPRQPGKRRDEDDADRQHGLNVSGAERRNHHDRQQQRRKREQAVHDAHQRRIQPASLVARGEPDGDAGAGADQHGDRAYRKRDAAAIEHPAEHVAAEPVGPKPMRSAREARAGPADRTPPGRSAPAPGPGSRATR